MNVNRKNFLRMGCGLAAIIAAKESPAIVRSLVGARSSIFEKTKLPYDSEVEYLESTGTQWIDTDYKLATPNAMRVILDFTSIAPNAQRNIFGSNDATGFNVYFQNATSFGFYLCGAYVLQGIPISQDVRSVLDITVPEGENSGVVIYEGVSYNTSPRQHVQSSTNFFIFTQVPEIQRVSKLRVFSCSIFDDGILVRDFIPVRFTNELGKREGAMYDKVSKKLFRNDGTGEFTIGPDKFHVNSYVTDGLIAMWDGEYKNEVDVKAETLEHEYWPDIVGGYDIPLTNTNGKIFPYWADYGEKYIDFNASKYVTNANRISIGSASAEEITYETVICGDGGAEKIFCNSVKGSTIYCQNGAKYMLPYNKNSFYVPNPSGTGFSNISFSEITINSVPKTISFSLKSGEQTMYVNGEIYATGTKTWNGTGALSLFGFESYNDETGRCWGRHYNDRLYSRALTAEEISANYAVDTARFNIPSA